MHGGASREENSRMRLKTMLLAAALAVALAQPAAAATFRLAFQGDLKSLDP